MLRVVVIAGIVLLLLVLPCFHAFGGDAKNEEIPKLVINEVFYSSENRALWWVEIYNPEARSWNIAGFEIWFSSINGPQVIETGDIKAHEYIVLCTSKENFTEYWGNVSARIFEINFGDRNDGITISTIIQENKSEKVIDMVNFEKEGKLPPLEEGHSWARYRGEYDVDNFTRNFYDEPEPTPGYENHRAKNPGWQDNMSYIVIGITLAGIIAVTAVTAYLWKKKGMR